MTVDILSIFTNLLNNLGSVLPLPVFVIIGSVLEELISPIPATLVLGVAGSYVALNSLSLFYLALLTLLATAGKTAAAWITYWLGRVLGEFVIKKWGKILGVKISDIHDINLKLKNKNEWLIVFALRALPLAPSAAVSIACGIIHTRQRVFTSATFAGYIIRNVLIAMVGFAGFDIFASWKDYANNQYYGIAAAIILTGIATYFLIKGYKKYYTKV